MKITKEQTDIIKDILKTIYIKMDSKTEDGYGLDIEETSAMHTIAEMIEKKYGVCIPKKEKFGWE